MDVKLLAAVVKVKKQGFTAFRPNLPPKEKILSKLLSVLIAASLAAAAPFAIAQNVQAPTPVVQAAPAPAAAPVAQNEIPHDVKKHHVTAEKKVAKSKKAKAVKKSHKAKKAAKTKAHKAHAKHASVSPRLDPAL